MKNLRINEIFGVTIQGEGKSVGKEVIFIRTALCNLQCIWCDTPYTWNFEGTKFAHNSDQKYSKEKEIHEMDNQTIIQKVFQCLYDSKKPDVRGIVISGGEPLLQQRELVTLIKELKNQGFWIEIETNGTIKPTDEITELIDQFNCSPKLENSKMVKSKREKPEALKSLSENGKTNFKFVVSNENDVQEIEYLIKTYNMQEVYIMPLGITRDELAMNSENAKALAEKLQVNFTDRLHITLLGGGRGL